VLLPLYIYIYKQYEASPLSACTWLYCVRILHSNASLTAIKSNRVSAGVMENVMSTGVRRGAVDWGTERQAERLRFRIPMESFGFLIALILPAALRLWG
jgi:hypothetical protein